MNCETCQDSGKTTRATWRAIETGNYACDEHGPFFLDDMTPEEGVLQQGWERLDRIGLDRIRRNEARKRLKEGQYQIGNHRFSSSARFLDGCVWLKNEYIRAEQHLQALVEMPRITQSHIEAAIAEQRNHAIITRAKEPEIRAMLTGQDYPPQDVDRILLLAELIHDSLQHTLERAARVYDAELYPAKRSK